MKTNVRNEDAIARAMGWLEQLREDGQAELVSEWGGEPAPIGDGLRKPIAWCEMGSCIIALRAPWDRHRAVSTPAVLTPSQGRHRESLRDSGRAS
jgi:hypothetical protein